MAELRDLYLAKAASARGSVRSGSPSVADCRKRCRRGERDGVEAGDDGFGGAGVDAVVEVGGFGGVAVWNMVRLVGGRGGLQVRKGLLGRSRAGVVTKAGCGRAEGMGESCMVWLRIGRTGRGGGGGGEVVVH